MQRGQHIAYTRGRAVEGWRAGSGQWLNASIPMDNRYLVGHLRDDMELGSRAVSLLTATR